MLQYKPTLFLQGLLQVPQQQSDPHKTFLPLQEHPRFPVPFLFMLQEVLQLQYSIYVKIRKLWQVLRDTTQKK